MSTPVAVLIVALLLGAPRQAAAQMTSEETARIENARRLRRVGIGLSTAGIVTEVATIALWGAAVGILNEGNNQGGEYGQTPSGYWPVFGFAVATTAAVPLLLAVGIPMWSVGARRLDRIRTTTPVVTISPTGVVRF